MTNIVFLCHNRLRLTEQALQSLYQHTPRESFNLTIVDDASDDFRLSKRLHEVAANANATYLRIEKSAHVLARAKNIGVAWSEQTFGRGDWLYLSDSDVWFSEGWLEKMTLAARVFPEFYLMGGQVHPFHQRISGAHYDNFDVAKTGITITEHSVLDGPSWLMHWETWDEYGPFDRKSAPGPCRSEEYPFCERLRAAHGRIGVIQPHVVAHTGLTQTDGKDAPGRKEREAQMIPGVLYL